MSSPGFKHSSLIQVLEPVLNEAFCFAFGLLFMPLSQGFYVLRHDMLINLCFRPSSHLASDLIKQWMLSVVQWRDSAEVAFCWFGLKKKLNIHCAGSPSFCGVGSCPSHLPASNRRKFPGYLSTSINFSYRFYILKTAIWLLYGLLSACCSPCLC